MNQTYGREHRAGASARAPALLHALAITASPVAAASSPVVGAQAYGTLTGGVSRRNAIGGFAAGAALGAVGLIRQARAQTPPASGPGISPVRKASTANTFLAASRAPADFSLPAELESVPLDPQTGFDLPIGRFRATFMPRAGLLGPAGDPELLLREPMIMGMIVTCLEDIWWIESESAGDRTFTMVAYDAVDGSAGSSRTAVLAGQGVVGGDGANRVTFTLQTVPALARSDRHDQITATVGVRSDGSYEGQVDVIEEAYGKGHGRCRSRCKGKPKAGKRRCRRRCHKHT